MSLSNVPSEHREDQDSVAVLPPSCRDGTSLEADGAATAPYKTKDETGHSLVTEFGLCQYRDHQVISVQVSLCSAFQFTDADETQSLFCMH